MFTGYVINLGRHSERLHQFNQHADSNYFERINAVDKNLLKLIDETFLFNSTRLEKQIKRPVTLGEIGCTLSHISAWRAFVNNPNSNDDGYAVIAEDDIQICENFSQKITLIINYLKQKTPLLNIVLLHKLGLYQPYLYDEKKATTYQIYSLNSSEQIDNDGSALYLIKKRYAKELLIQLENQKPYWLADHFSTFCHHIGIVQPFLGTTPKHSLSDLESEREEARKIKLF